MWLQLKNNSNLDRNEDLKAQTLKFKENVSQTQLKPPQPLLAAIKEKRHLEDESETRWQ